MITYHSTSEYLDSITDLKSKIAAIDDIINTLFATAAKGALKEHITEYSLNTGQTQIKTSFRSVKDIQETIISLESLKVMYASRLPGNGRVSRLVDIKNMRRRC